VIYYISNASSYLSDDPMVCINCHVMTPQYATWQHSSHARAVSCMDCHVPHDHFIHKYEFKMKDGLRHAAIFTLRQEPQVIRIKEEGAAVVQENCIRCHKAALEGVGLQHSHYQQYEQGETRLCWFCHRDVPHGQVRSLSATPYVQQPDLPGTTPDWLKTFYSVVGQYNQYQKKENEP